MPSFLFHEDSTYYFFNQLYGPAKVGYPCLGRLGVRGVPSLLSCAYLSLPSRNKHRTPDLLLLSREYGDIVYGLCMDYIPLFPTFRQVSIRIAVKIVLPFSAPSVVGPLQL